MERDEILDDLKVQFGRNFRLGAVTGEEVLKFFAASEVEVTWLREFEEGRVWALVAKPRSRPLVEGLGLQREVLVLCSNFSEFQPRVLNRRRSVEAALQTPGRLDYITIVVNDAPELRELLAKLEDPLQILMGLDSREIHEALKSGHPSERFREVLQERLYARDFFDRSGPVGGHDFFGRQLVLQDIAIQLERGSHVGLYGLRKVGKTSLIKALLERRDRLLPKGIIVHIDLLSVLPANRTYHYLLFQIALELRRLGFRMRSVSKIERYDEIGDLASLEREFDSDFRSALADLAANERRLVLVLDEVERLFPSSDLRSGFEGYDIFLEYVRGISQSAGPLSLLVVGVNPHVSEAEYLGKRQNPMFGFLVNRYAPPMMLDEVKDMVKILGRSSGARFAHDAIEAIYSSVGGHPFLVRKYCSLLIRDRVRPTEVAALDVKSSEELFLRQETSHFAEMVSVVKEYYPDEFRALHDVALQGDVDVSRINRRILAHLEGYQLVEEVDGKIRMRYRLMREWMLGVTRRVAAEVSRPVASLPASLGSGPSTIDEDLVRYTIKELEQSLRRVVCEVLERRWGGRAEKRIEGALGADAVRAARERLEKSLRFRQESDSPTEELLEFLYIGDLQKIVLGNEWQDFRLIFEDKRETERNLQIISRARNEVQHFRPLPPMELIKAYVAGSEVLELLRKAENVEGR